MVSNKRRLSHTERLVRDALRAQARRYAFSGNLHDRGISSAGQYTQEAQLHRELLAIANGIEQRTIRITEQESTDGS